MRSRFSTILAMVLVLNLVLVMAGPTAAVVVEESTDPHSGSEAVSDDLIGEVEWQNHEDVYAQDGDHAEATLWVGANTSEYLKVTGFGFDIPSSAMIDGIVVEVDRYASASGVSDYGIQLVKAGDIVGNNKSVGTPWPTSETDDYQSYGGESDLWTESWNATDINDPDFGVAISAVLDTGVSNARVDHIRITVYYNIEKYTINVEVSPNSYYGSASDVTGEPPYLPGEQVNVVAVPNTGYKFVEWKSKEAGGGPETQDLFDPPNQKNSVFTMPAYNVTITAYFELDLGPQVDPTITTLPASGKSKVTATLNLEYTMGDYSEVWIRWAYKESAACDDCWTHTGSDRRTTPEGSHAELIAGLTPGTEYDFKAQIYGDHWIDGDILHFTTDTLSSLGCFIATAAYGTPTAEQIDVLREFRDSVLLESTVGSVFVSLYYQLSPPIADFVAGNEFLRTMVRELLIDPIVWAVEATGDVWQN